MTALGTWHTGRVRAWRTVAAAIAAVFVAASAGGCAEQLSQAEHDAALAAFDALDDEAKAFACADDWYAVLLGVEGFVIVERCGTGSGVPVTSSQPLSASFEQAEQAYAAEYYAANPPDSGLLDGVDVDVLCTQDEAQITSDIERWRKQTQFPSWNGVEFVPSVEHEVAKLLIWQEVACPLVEGSSVSRPR